MLTFLPTESRESPSAIHLLNSLLTVLAVLATTPLTPIVPDALIDLTPEKDETATGTEIGM